MLSHSQFQPYFYFSIYSSILSRHGFVAIFDKTIDVTYFLEISNCLDQRNKLGHMPRLKIHLGIPKKFKAAGLCVYALAPRSQVRYVA